MAREPHGMFVWLARGEPLRPDCAGLGWIKDLAAGSTGSRGSFTCVWAVIFIVHVSSSKVFNKRFSGFFCYHLMLTELR